MSLTQLTDGPTEDLLPIWNPDGSRVFFSSDRTGNFEVYSQAWDGASGPRLEFAGPETQFPNAFTLDGRQLIVYHFFKDLGIVDLDEKPARMTPLLNSTFDERVCTISPDGKWLAYESDESGKQFEIMVRPFPNVGDRREQISIDGGRFPHWSPKGDELYYVTPNGEMMSVPVTLSPVLKLGRPSKLFDGEKPPVGRSGVPYDVSPVDGRFIMKSPVAQNPNAPTNVSVVLNWSEDLRKRFQPH